MTQVDFYVLEQNSSQDKYFLCCRITEKAWKSGNRVMIQAGSEEEARHLDNLLWTFRDQSFIPHSLLPDAELETTPVVIGWGTDARGENDVLINLGKNIPEFFSSFRRVIEVVDSDPGTRETSREHFRYYRDRGYRLKNREIKG